MTHIFSKSFFYGNNSCFELPRLKWIPVGYKQLLLSPSKILIDRKHNKRSKRAKWIKLANLFAHFERNVFFKLLNVVMIIFRATLSV